jgi:hypothetical protein
MISIVIVLSLLMCKITIRRRFFFFLTVPTLQIKVSLREAKKLAQSHTARSSRENRSNSKVSCFTCSCYITLLWYPMP